MLRQKGYYFVILAGCSDGESIAYCDGENIYLHGYDKDASETILWISKDPINLKDIKCSTLELLHKD